MTLSGRPGPVTLSGRPNDTVGQARASLTLLRPAARQARVLLQPGPARRAGRSRLGRTVTGHSTCNGMQRLQLGLAGLRAGACPRLGWGPGPRRCCLQVYNPLARRRCPRPGQRTDSNHAFKFGAAHRLPPGCRGCSRLAGGKRHNDRSRSRTASARV